jgi:spermidine/putrescine transport system substrate-binding protein
MTSELIISTWSGFFADAVRQSLVEPFQREFNVRVRVGVTGNASELMTRIRAGATGGGGDVVDLFWNEYPTAYTATRQGWVEPLRVENIPNYASVLPIFNKQQRPVPWDPGDGIHAAPAQMVSRGIAYDPAHINRRLETLAELWNGDIGQRIAIFNNTSWMVGNAAFRTGQDPNAIADLDKVWDALRAQRRVVGRYFNNLVEGQEMFRNGTAWIAPLNGGRVLDLRSQGLRLEYYKPREGWMLNADVLQIGKGSPNRFTAEKFIDFFYRSDIVTRASELMNFPIASRNVQGSEIVRNLPDFDPTGELAGARFYDPTYWDANTSQWTEKVREIIAS